MQNPHCGYVGPDGNMNMTDETTTPKIDYSVSDIHINDQESIQYIGQNNQSQEKPTEMCSQARQILKQASHKKFEPAIHNTSEEVGPPRGTLHNA